MDDSLQELLIAAGEAPPSRRIEYRDQLAHRGIPAIEQMADWANDPNYAAFAVRVIGRAVELGFRVEGIAALRVIAQDSAIQVARTDAQAELGRLGAVSTRRSPGPRRPASTSKPLPTLSPEDLVLGREYRRASDLHESGLGGNRQKGISYPAAGDYVLLFSDPDARRDYGYKDSWKGQDAYMYFGEWNGTLQMVLAGGNQAILDRSPNLHLFVKSRNGHRYEGRFTCSGHETEWTERDGRSQQAIVFTLQRASSQGS